MKKIVAMCLVLLSPSVAADNPLLVPFVEFISALAWKDNYKRIPQLEGKLSDQGERVDRNNTDLDMIIGSQNCRRYISPEGSGKVCLIDDGTWQIVEEYK